MIQIPLSAVTVIPIGRIDLHAIAPVDAGVLVHVDSRVAAEGGGSPSHHSSTDARIRGIFDEEWFRNPWLRIISNWKEPADG